MKEGREPDPMSADRWAEALTWYEILHEMEQKDVTQALAREWPRWYADAENQRIFIAVSRLVGNPTLYRRRHRHSRAELEADPYDPSVPIAEWRRRHSPRLMRKECALVGSRTRRPSGGFAVGSVALIATLVILWLPRFGSAERSLSSPAVYQTNVAELRTVHLRDGSTIILGARTELSVAFSGRRRSVELAYGQAWFKVAHHPNWPFVVAAGDGTIADVGTAFVVTRENHRVVVTVTDGTVEVSTQKARRGSRTIGQGATAAWGLTPILVTEGEKLAYSDRGAPSLVTHADLHAVTTWTQGRLTFDNESLQDVVAAVDRYSSRRITISRKAGSLRFSGIVLPEEINDWLHGLEKIFPVRVEQRGAAVCIDVRTLTHLHRQTDASCSTQP